MPEEHIYNVRVTVTEERVYEVVAETPEQAEAEYRDTGYTTETTDIFVNGVDYVDGPI